VGLNYPDDLSFLKDLEGIKARLFTTPPFDALKEKINISFLTLSKEQEQNLFQRQDNLPPLKVRADLLASINQEINPYKLVILDFQGTVHCAELSSLEKTSILIIGRSRPKNDFTKSFLHELGHALGLRDECTNCPQTEPGFPNCATDLATAKKWWGKWVGRAKDVDYFYGCCGNKNYLRPTASSLMNDPERSADFGYVNELFLEKEFEFRQEN